MRGGLAITTLSVVNTCAFTFLTAANHRNKSKVIIGRAEAVPDFQDTNDAIQAKSRPNMHAITAVKSGSGGGINPGHADYDSAALTS